MEKEFKCLNAIDFMHEDASFEISNEAKDFIVFIRQNNFKDLYDNPRSYYAALEREEDIQRSLPSGIDNYPLPGFVRDCVSVRIASTPDRFEYLILSPKDYEPAGVVMYICGGGFMSQPMDSHWDMICDFVQELACEVAVPLHPLLPKCHYEQAREYLLAVYQNVLASNTNVVLAGDSSGGWCALATALWAKEQGIGQPNRIVLVSPLLDLSDGNTEMRKAFAEHDEMLSPWGITEAGRLWTPNFLDRTLWPPSPAFASFEGLAPIDIIIGGNEMLIADLRLLQGAVAAEQLRVAVYPGMWHAFPLFSGIPESCDARELIIKSIREHWLNVSA